MNNADWVEVCLLTLAGTLVLVTIVLLALDFLNMARVLQ